MHKRSFLQYLLFVCLLVSGGFWAYGSLKLLDPEYNFGIIREVDGEKSGSARLVNIGDSVTYISDVRPSCGCTAAYYSEELLLPGDTAVIKFEYDPKGRPGNFNKTIKVYEGNAGERYIIKLSGRVLGSEESLSRNYPVECGRLRLSERIIDLSKIRGGAGRHTFVRMVNQSMDTITPEWKNNDKALSIDITPKVLAPGEIATLGIYFNSKFEDKTGNVEYVIPIKAREDSIGEDIILRSEIIPMSTSEETEETLSE